jgi:hypothetical protein
VFVYDACWVQIVLKYMYKIILRLAGVEFVGRIKNIFNLNMVCQV